MLRRRREERNTGFSYDVNNRSGRLLRADGRFAVVRTGVSLSEFSPYFALVNVSWTMFFVAVFAFYTVLNLVFTAVYLFIGVEYLSHNGESFPFWSDFWRAFFFSTQTFTTVGYGGIVPLGLATSFVASIEALAGIMTAALMSGLFFARFSKPTPGIMFSEVAVVRPFSNGTALMFRVASRRNNTTSKVSIKVLLAFIGINAEGKEYREYDDLTLETQEVEMLPLNWTIVHLINEESPLWKKTITDYEQMNVEIMVTVTGHDDTFSQFTHSRRSYRWHEIHENYKFLPMYQMRPDGVTVLDLSKISSIEKVNII